MTDDRGTMKQGRWRIVIAGVLWAAVTATVLTTMTYFGFKPEGPDAWTYDWRTFLFSKRPIEQRNDVAIILIGEESLADYDYLSPADRGLLANLIRALDEAKPKAIGLDFLFDRKTDNGKTQALIDAIKKARTPVVIAAIDDRATSFKQNSLSYQDEFIKASGAKTGHAFFARDFGKMKISETVVRYIGDPADKSLAAVLANLDKPRKVPRSPYIAWLVQPADGDLFPTFRVPRHAPGAGPDIVLPPRWRAALKDKIVLIGGEFGDRDRHLTPLSIWDNTPVPGVTIQAQILAQFLDGRTVVEMPLAYEFTLLALAALSGFLISYRLPSKRYDWALYGAGIVVLVITGIGLFWAYSIILPTTTLLFAWTAGVSGAHYSKTLPPKLRIKVGLPPASAAKLGVYVGDNKGGLQ